MFLNKLGKFMMLQINVVCNTQFEYLHKVEYDKC